MAKVKIENIVFWILIIIIIAIIIWKLFGSPTDLATYLSIFSIMTALIISIWKGIYNLEIKLNNKITRLDRKTSMSFMRLKNDLDNINKLVKRLAYTKEIFIIMSSKKEPVKLLKEIFPDGVLDKNVQFFKVDDLIYIFSEDYCFVGAPDEIKEQFEGIKIKQLRFADFSSECSEKDIDVCFDDSVNCDVSVSGELCEGFFCDDAYKYGIVSKEGKDIKFVTDALMYSAIFSDSGLYECNFNRLMNRLGMLIGLYKSKIDFTDTKCDSKSINAELDAFKDYTKLGSTEQLFVSSKSLDEENSQLECPVF